MLYARWQHLDVESHQKESVSPFPSLKSSGDHFNDGRLTQVSDFLRVTLFLSDDEASCCGLTTSRSLASSKQNIKVRLDATHQTEKT